MVQTRSMIKRENFNNLIHLLPDEIEKYLLLYLKDELILNWDYIIKKNNYKNFKNYMKNGMGMSLKSEKLIRKYYINWIMSHKYRHAYQLGYYK